MSALNLHVKILPVYRKFYQLFNHYNVMCPLELIAINYDLGNILHYLHVFGCCYCIFIIIYHKTVVNHMGRYTKIALSLTINNYYIQKTNK